MNLKKLIVRGEDVTSKVLTVKLPDPIYRIAGSCSKFKYKPQGEAIVYYNSGESESISYPSSNIQITIQL